MKVRVCEKSNIEYEVEFDSDISINIGDILEFADDFMMEYRKVKVVDKKIQIKKGSREAILVLVYENLGDHYD